jgi:RNA polymerase sigma factor (sigma-70 family)
MKSVRRCDRIMKSGCPARDALARRFTAPGPRLATNRHTRVTEWQAHITAPWRHRDRQVIQSRAPIVYWEVLLSGAMTRGSQAIRLLSNPSSSNERLWSRRSEQCGNGGTKIAVKVEWANLIGRVAEGDRGAFGRLFEHFAPRVKGLMLRAGASSEDADEIAQETLLAVWRKAAQFDPASAGASAWIYTIARNLRIDAIRRAARTGAVDHEVELEYLPDPAEPADVAIGRVDEVKQVTAALSGLSKDQSLAIQLSFIEERPHSEIADILGIPLGTVKSRVRLAMNRLKALMDETR